MSRPDDFAAIVDRHRTRVQRDAANRACPECHAPGGVECTNLDRPERDPRAGIGHHGMHHQRLHHGDPTVTPHDRRTP